MIIFRLYIFHLYIFHRSSFIDRLSTINFQRSSFNDPLSTIIDHRSSMSKVSPGTSPGLPTIATLLSPAIAPKLVRPTAGRRNRSLTWNRVFVLATTE